MEQALGIALALGLLHGLLVSQEGGTLGKEDRKGTQANVLHRVRGVITRASVVKLAQDLAQMRQVLIPGFEDLGAHAINLRRASAPSALR